MLRNVFGLIVALLALSAPVRADTLKVMAAGSLRAAVTDLLHRFPLQSDTVDPPEFGFSGLLRQKIETAQPLSWLYQTEMSKYRGSLSKSSRAHASA